MSAVRARLMDLPGGLDRNETRSMAFEQVKPFAMVGSFLIVLTNNAYLVK